MFQAEVHESVMFHLKCCEVLELFGSNTQRGQMCLTKTHHIFCVSDRSSHN